MGRVPHEQAGKAGEPEWPPGHTGALPATAQWPGPRHRPQDGRAGLVEGRAQAPWKCLKASPAQSSLCPRPTWQRHLSLPKSPPS